MSTKTESREELEIDPDDGLSEDGGADKGTEGEAVESAQSGEKEAGSENAPYRKRICAYAIDVLGPVAAVTALGLIVAVDPRNHWLQIVCIGPALLLVAFILWNTIRQQGATGRTIGKTIFGLRTVDSDTESSTGWPRALGRETAHILDTAPLFAGWLWPLRDKAGQSFADKTIRTRVVVDRQSAAPSKGPIWVGFGVLVVLVTTVAGLTVTQYVHDYRRDQNTADIAHIAQDVAQKSTVALLSYQASSVDKDLAAASDRLTGKFKDYYDEYTKNVVIPTAHEKTVNTQAQCVGSSLVSADDRHAEVLLFINQTTTTAENPQPSVAASTVRVQLTRVGDQWLISEFDPV